MVLDNIEVNNDYRGVADDIRKNLFEYVADFGDHIIKDPKRKINTVLLGTNYNDVETRDLPHIKTTIKKIGGAGVSGTQYLDSFGSAWVDSSKFTHREFFVAMDDLREKSIKSKKDFEKRITKPEIISKLDKRTIKEIVKVEEASFPFEMQSDEENLLKTLKNENGIHIVLRNSQGEVVGYLSSLPQKDAYEDLKDWDDKMQPEEKALYVESIAIEPEYRDVKNLLSLGKSLIEEAKKRGFRKITMHARVASDLSSVLQKRYGAKFLYRIENWHNFQEPFDYLEIEVKS